MGEEEGVRGAVSSGCSLSLGKVPTDSVPQMCLPQAAYIVEDPALGVGVAADDILLTEGIRGRTNLVQVSHPIFSGG